MRPDDEDEYSYPPERPIDLAAHGVQIVAPSKRRGPTKRVYREPLTDAQLAACRAKSRARRP